MNDGDGVSSEELGGEGVRIPSDQFSHYIQDTANLVRGMSLRESSIDEAVMMICRTFLSRVCQYTGFRAEFDVLDTSGTRTGRFARSRKLRCPS